MAITKYNRRKQKRIHRNFILYGCPEALNYLKSDNMCGKQIYAKACCNMILSQITAFFRDMKLNNGQKSSHRVRSRSFSLWSQLPAMINAQFSGRKSLSSWCYYHWPLSKGFSMGWVLEN